MCGSRWSRLVNDKCHPVCAIVFVLGLLVSGLATAANCSTHMHNLQPYINTELGVEFCFPSGLFVQTEGQDIYVLNYREAPRRDVTLGGNNPELLMNGKRLVEPYDYLLHIKLGDGDFDATNNREGIFDCDKDRRCHSRIGRFRPSTAKHLRGKAWKGYMTEVICSISDAKTGFHAAGGDCLWLLGSDGQRSFVLNTLGEQVHAEVARSVIKSLRLISK